MDNNVYNVHYGVVPILKTIRKLKNDSYAGMATYALIMFGMIFILYLFGFSSLWASYQTHSSLETNSAVNVGVGVLDTMTKAISNNVALITGSAAAMLGAAFFARWIFGAETAATILQYSIPILLLIALNIFIFPLSGLEGSVGFMDTVSSGVTLFLFGFFNLFFILSALEYVRGNI